jgi:type II restriction/modification system DNA methylase subunit YeeA
MPMTVSQFTEKWNASRRSERSASQEHFLDLCELLGHPKPADIDPTGEFFTFEKRVAKVSRGKGWADVWKRGFFGWEYKGDHKDLHEAYLQLLDYREDLENPPLLVVSDMTRYEVHTNFENTKKQIFAFTQADLYLNKPTETCPAPPLDVLRWVFTDPNELRPEAASRRVTEEAAEKFCRLAESIELDGADPRRGADRQKVAHFLMRLLFCLFADSIGLLPGHVFRELIESHRGKPRALEPKLRALFRAMSEENSAYGPWDIRWFNGGLFNDDSVLELNGADTGILCDAAKLDWSSVAPSIFGTLFERSLNAEKRSQIGAHYTSEADIALIVEPVVMEPLHRRWNETREEIESLAEQAAVVTGAAHRSLRRRMQGRLDDWMAELGRIRVLDPACGSGNFLYVTLRRLLELWWQAHTLGAQHALLVPPASAVTPAQLYGIEVDYYAHELASIVVWIGYVQWLHEHATPIPDHPVLQKLENIRQGDAILARDPQGRLQEPDWPEVDFIISNPPFLGGNKQHQELGNEYVDNVRQLYGDRVPAGADLVLYWFERARAAVEQGRAQRAGLIGTQAIRGGVNRRVLEQIKASGDIFLAWSDLPWVLDGAAVRISIVCFDAGREEDRWLDGERVTNIYADLTALVDVTTAKDLGENLSICFRATEKGGPFELDPSSAAKIMREPVNVNGHFNADVLRRWLNSDDITGRDRGFWIIDFYGMEEKQAAQYELPFHTLKQRIESERKTPRGKRKPTLPRERWWLFRRSGKEMREAIQGLRRYIATITTGKHRLFVWLDPSILPDHQLYVFARDDDYFFGVLHSRVHEIWARQTGTQLREVESGFRYTPTSTFERFPLPWPPGHEPNDDPRLEAIAAAARELVRLRDNWLNPAGATDHVLKKRTLTNLYNEHPAWLEQAHARLDAAVFAAYGWPATLTNQEILERLVVLNHQRAESA